MNPTTIDQEAIPENMQPGAFLAKEREKRGISIEQIATKLNLRVQVLSFLESDQYEELPEPVFVQGYIRAYCKYLGLPADAIIAAYLTIKPEEQRAEKFLWQNQQHPNKNEKWLYWMTIIFIGVTVISVSTWMYENKSTVMAETNRIKATSNIIRKVPKAETASSETNTKLGDLSKMRSLLMSPKQENFSPKDME